MGHESADEFFVQVCQLTLLRGSQVTEDVTKYIAPSVMLLFENSLAERGQPQTDELAILLVMLASHPVDLHEPVDERGGGRRGDVKRFRELFHRETLLFADQEECVNVKKIRSGAHFHAAEHLLSHNAAEVVGAIDQPVERILWATHDTIVK